MREQRSRKLREQPTTTTINPNEKCDRVDPASRRMLQEKFEMAESYLGRLIANVLKKVTNKKDIEGVRDA